MAEYIEREATKRTLAASGLIPKYVENNRPITDRIIDRIPAADVLGADELYEKQLEAYDLGYQSCLNYKGLKWTEAEELQRYREANVVEGSAAQMEQLFHALSALADMVNQFGYSTTFRKQDAVCDGGLSALETAFAALNDCGCRVNSNWTISRKNLWEFADKCKELSESYGERKEQ